MKLARVELAKYQLPLTRRFRAGGVDVQAREGRLVRLTADDGSVGYGEVSPLPGLHVESMAEVDEVLGTIGGELTAREFQDFDAYAQNVANRAAAHARHDDFGCPSVVFGLQGAGLALLAHRDGTTPAALLSDAPQPHVPINALFTGTAEEAETACLDGTLAGYPVVKVKCGLRSAADDRRVVRALLEGLAPTVRLRLDANRGLELADAVERFRGLPVERIEYLEEPLADPTQLADLHAATGLAIGLDETLHHAAHYDIGRAPWVAAWCLKPSRIGHWKRTRFLASEAQRHGAMAVVSSALETGLGLSMQAQMAAALPARLGACGLGTETWLKLDIVDPPYDASAGRVATADWRGDVSAAVLAKLRFKPLG